MSLSSALIACSLLAEARSDRGVRPAMTALAYWTRMASNGMARNPRPTPGGLIGAGRSMVVGNGNFLPAHGAVALGRSGVDCVIMVQICGAARLRWPHSCQRIRLEGSHARALSSVSCRTFEQNGALASWESKLPAAAGCELPPTRPCEGEDVLVPSPRRSMSTRLKARAGSAQWGRGVPVSCPGRQRSRQCSVRRHPGWAVPPAPKAV